MLSLLHAVCLKVRVFFRTSWGVGVLNSAKLSSVHNRVEIGTILEGLQNFGGGV